MRNGEQEANESFVLRSGQSRMYNKPIKEGIKISDYKLANDKIDIK
jgi:hypothetical protein